MDLEVLRSQDLPFWDPSRSGDPPQIGPLRSGDPI